MKRKEISEDDDNKRARVSLLPVIALRCQICNTQVYDYKQCISPFTYCSLECFEVLYLMYHGLKQPSFNDDLEELYIIYSWVCIIYDS